MKEIEINWSEEIRKVHRSESQRM